jgi:hypothetical protein
MIVAVRTVYPKGAHVSDSTTTTPVGELLTDAEVAELNAAQRTLRRISDRARDGSWRQPSSTAWSLGMLAGACDVARDATFNVLNVANSHGLAELTREQLHDQNRDSKVQS